VSKFKRISFLSLLLVGTLFLSTFTSAIAKTPKSGASCTKLGITKDYKAKKYTCIKSGKKLVWNKGVAIKTAAPAISPTPSPTPIPTPSPTQTENWVETDRSLLKDSKVCKISRPAGYDENIGHYGFPRGANFLPSEGTLRGLILHVDFADAKASITTSQNALPYVEDFSKFWTSMSRSKIRFEIDSLNNWISLPKTAYEYAGEWNHSPQMENYAKEVISRADSFVDFSKYKIVYIIPPDNVKRFFQVGPVMSSGNNTYFSSADGPINNLVIGTSPEISMGGVKWKWLAHETGHLFGIDHPHSYENNDKKLASIFSLMDFGYVAPGLYGIERWIAGWIPENLIRCIDGRDQKGFSYIHKITPLGSSKGDELISIRLSERSSIIAENRQANEFDILPAGYEGLLVYEVDAARVNGPIKPILGSRYVIDQSKPEYNGSRVVGTLRVGESIAFEGIQITVLKKENDSYFVKTERQ